MASFVYNNAKKQLGIAGINLQGDLRVMLVMTNTTADTEDDAEFIASFTTLDEYDGAAYTRVALTGETVALDSPNNRAELDAGDVTFATIGAGTRLAQGIILYLHVTNDADSRPIAFIDSFTSFNGNGGNVAVTWNAEGILHIA